MSFTPEYGETPVDDEDAQALTPEAREQLGEHPRKADIYAIEQQIEAEVAEHMVIEIAQGKLDLHDLIHDHFVRHLHRLIYGDIWTWAGKYRTREVNIGIAPEQIAMTLRGSLQSILYRYENTTDWNPRQLGVSVHAETVRIHPFVDGNGRTTRLLANLVFLAAQNDEQLQEYDWDLDKTAYIEALRRYDRHLDPRELATLIEVKTFGG